MGPPELTGLRIFSVLRVSECSKLKIWIARTARSLGFVDDLDIPWKCSVYTNGYGPFKVTLFGPPDGLSQSYDLISFSFCVHLLS